jgi:branched-chain amino acid transport system ATP-binding protein
MSATLLTLDRVRAGYLGASVIRDLSLTVREGEVVAILGPNGAGKSTTLRVISATVPLMSGQVTALGMDVAKTAPHVLARRGLGHVPEGRGVFYGLTVAEHQRIGPRSASPDADRVLEYFPALAPLRNRRAGLLSGGEQQMLALGRTMARRPRLMLVDELSMGLAPIIVERLLPVLRAYADDTGAGVLLVEQHVEAALDVADRAYVLAHGDLILEGNGADLRHNQALLVGSYLGHDMSS